MPGSIRVTANCSTCGAVLTLPVGVVDTTQLTCENCGKDVGTYGDFKSQARKAGHAYLDWLLKEAMKL